MVIVIVFIIVLVVVIVLVIIIIIIIDIIFISWWCTAANTTIRNIKQFLRTEYSMLGSFP